MQYSARFFFIVMLQCILVSNSLRAQNIREVIPNTADSTPVWDLTISHFLNKVATLPSTITGGCASLTSGATPISLMMLALEISKSKLKDSTKKIKVEKIISELKKKQDTILIFAAKDMEIFQKFLQVSHLPKSTYQEKRFRDSAYHKALIDATESPLEAAQLVARIFRIINQSIEYSSQNVISDMGASTFLLGGTFDAILLLAQDNINSFKGDEMNKFIKIKSIAIKQADGYRQNIFRKIAKKMKVQ
jgi:formiminotetrahydrofolate cyclodeaminase